MCVCVFFYSLCVIFFFFFFLGGWWVVLVVGFGWGERSERARRHSRRSASNIYIYNISYSYILKRRGVFFCNKWNVCYWNVTKCHENVTFSIKWNVCHRNVTKCHENVTKMCNEKSPRKKKKKRLGIELLKKKKKKRRHVES